MQRNFGLVIFLLGLHLPGLGQIFHVLAEPHLNLRKAPVDGAIIEAIGYGDQVESTGIIHQRDTINGLPGQWIEVRWSPADFPVQTGVVFDAYLWPGEVPLAYDDWARKRGESPEGWTDYLQRVVDGEAMRLYGACYEDYGGPSSDETFAEVVCSSGQALAFFRCWVLRTLGHPLPEETASYGALMRDMWDFNSKPVLSFSRTTEGGNQTWSVEMIGGEIPLAFRFSFSSATC